MNTKQYAYSSEPDEILIERSRDLMQTPDELQHELMTLISFAVGGIRYAMNSKSVARVIDPVDTSGPHQSGSAGGNSSALSKLSILPIPQTQNFILGIVNIRGNLHTVIDLSQLLLQTPTIPSVQSQLILLQGDEYDICILTEGKAETLLLHNDDLHPMDNTLPHSLQGVISGAVPWNKSFIGLLDPRQLFQHQQLLALLQ